MDIRVGGVPAAPGGTERGAAEEGGALHGTLRQEHWASPRPHNTVSAPSQSGGGGAANVSDGSPPGLSDLQALLEGATTQAETLRSTLRGIATAVSAAAALGERVGAPRRLGSAPKLGISGRMDLASSKRLRKGFSSSWQPNTLRTNSLLESPAEPSTDVFAVRHKQRMPRYTGETLPEVEVKFTVHALADLKPEQNQFFADVGVVIEWVDTNLSRDVHYAEDYRTQQLKLFPAVERSVFNPAVRWDNSSKCMLQPGADELPHIVCEDDEGGVRMRKEMRYNGRFSCNESSYEKFPFDHHALPLCLTSLSWQNLGPPRLKGPLRRDLHAQYGAQGSFVEKPKPEHTVMKRRVHLGELQYVGYGVRRYREGEDGRQELDRDNHYELNVFVARNAFTHFFDFVVLLIMVCVSSISFCCNLNDDALAGRLSITLTVLLSLIAYISQRPSAIQTVPYGTVFDHIARYCVVVVAFMSICNVATVQLCFAVEPTQECSLCVDVTQDLCHRGNVGYTSIDDYFLLFFGVLVFLYLLLQRCRLLSEQRSARELWRKLCVDPDEPGELDKDAVADSVAEGSSSRLLAKAREKMSLASRFFQTSRKPWNAGEMELRQVPSPAPRNSILVGLEGTVVAHVLDFGGGEVNLYRYIWDADAPGEHAFKVERAFGSLKMSTSRLAGAVLGALGAAGEAALAELGAELRRYVLQAVSSLDPIELDISEWSVGKSVTSRTTSRSNTKGSVAPFLFVGITGPLQKELAAMFNIVPASSQEDVLEPRREAVGRLITLLRNLEDGEPAEQPSLGSTAGASSSPWSSWRVRPFLLPPEREASFERKGIAWLVDNADLGLTDLVAAEPRLQPYLRSQVSSWVLLHGKTQTGLLDKTEFLEMFLSLSNQVNLEDRLLEAESWFDAAVGDHVGAEGADYCNVDQIMDLILGHDFLLQAVIRHRLFVGSLAGSTSSFQLTVADPQNQRRDAVKLYAAPIGNLSPVTGHGLRGEQRIFRPQRNVTYKELQHWQQRLDEALNGDLVGSEQWPCQRRGIFVGVASMFYAAKAAGIDGRFVSKRTALEALGAALDREMAVGDCDVAAEASDSAPPGSLEERGMGEVPPGSSSLAGVEAHQQLVANLAIAKALIDYALHEDAWLYFRREWHVAATESGAEPTKVIATWSLGWFLRGILNDGGWDKGCDAWAGHDMVGRQRTTHFQFNASVTGCCSCPRNLLRSLLWACCGRRPPSLGARQSDSYSTLDSSRNSFKED